MKSIPPFFAAPLEFERLYVRPAAGRVLIVGSRVYPNREDRRRKFSNVVGVDMLPGEGVDRVLNLEETPPADLGTFDHIECVSVLEHSPRPWLLAANLERLMRPKATMHLTVPFAWRVHGYPQDFFRFTADGIRSLFPAIEWAVLMYGNDRLDADCSGMGDRNKSGHRMLLRTEVFGFGVRA